MEIQKPRNLIFFGYTALSQSSYIKYSLSIRRALLVEKEWLLDRSRLFRCLVDLVIFGTCTYSNVA
ncbi:unnamed protein product [Periconia digitata]|uniref:Uncharacterized protein n=1 Tax=Periconia digitata TaxID=1303443 RepID=A0A9W4XY99_9PLEO|nr:unnamed protein product [Periconia digitata]